jgi:N-acetylmuramoyl-L-alanine amidase
MSNISNLQLAEFAVERYESGQMVYWYGTYCLPCTTSLYSRKKKQYPAHYTAARASDYQKDIRNNKTCADCIGFIKGAVWSECGQRAPVYASGGCPDRSADGMLAYCKSKGMENGRIATLPEIPGLLLHKSGHVGVYVGNGWAIEAQGFATDIVRTKVQGRGWVSWAKMPFIRYEAGAVAAPERALGDRTLYRGCKGSDVEQLQAALLALGFDLGKWGPAKNGVDGDYGQATTAAVKAFQQRAGISADGIFGSVSYEALKEAERTGFADPEEGGAPDESGAADDDKDDGQAPSDEGAVSVPAFVRATANVNIRAKPNTGAKIYTVLKKGNKIAYSGTTQKGWHGVVNEKNGKIGWISGRYSVLVETPKAIIDLSQYNAVTDWDALRDSVAFLWLRIGLRSQSADGALRKDAKFQQYAAECAKRGIPFGAYFFGRAASAAAALEESQATAGWAEAFSPAVYAYVASAETVTHASIQAFCDDLAKRTGQPVGAQIAHHRYTQYDADKLKTAYMWIPRYGSDDGSLVAPQYPCDVHQFTSRGRVPGVEGYVNLNHVTGQGKALGWFTGGGR